MGELQKISLENKMDILDEPVKQRIRIEKKERFFPIFCPLRLRKKEI